MKTRMEFNIEAVKKEVGSSHAYLMNCKEFWNHQPMRRYLERCLVIYGEYGEKGFTPVVNFSYR